MLAAALIGLVISVLIPRAPVGGLKDGAPDAAPPSPESQRAAAR
jgi:hypothetical protein